MKLGLEVAVVTLSGEADTGWWLSTRGDGGGGNRRTAVVVVLHHGTGQAVASPRLLSSSCGTGELDRLRLVVQVAGMVAAWVHGCAVLSVYR